MIRIVDCGGCGEPLLVDNGSVAVCLSCLRNAFKEGFCAGIVGDYDEQVEWEQFKKAIRRGKDA